MKKTMFEPLDSYEEELINDLENGEFKPVKNEKNEIKRITEIFRSAAKKEKRITIRIAQKDLEDIQKKAEYSNIPYQTLVASILHQFATGKVKIEM
jgi:predicted DNA binding CopG/RHH family protein